MKTINIKKNIVIKIFFLKHILDLFILFPLKNIWINKSVSLINFILYLSYIKLKKIKILQQINIYII